MNPLQFLNWMLQNQGRQNQNNQMANWNQMMQMMNNQNWQRAIANWQHAGAAAPGILAGQQWINMGLGNLQGGINNLMQSFDKSADQAWLAQQNNKKYNFLLMVMDKLVGRGRGGEAGALAELAGAKGAVSSSGDRGHINKGGAIVTKEGIKDSELAVKSVPTRPRTFRGLDEQENQQVRGGADAALAGFANIEAPKMRKKQKDLQARVKKAQSNEMYGNVKSQRSRDQLLSKAKSKESKQYQDMLNMMTSLLG